MYRGLLLLLCRENNDYDMLIWYGELVSNQGELVTVPFQKFKLLLKDLNDFQNFRQLLET